MNRLVVGTLFAGLLSHAVACTHRAPPLPKTSPDLLIRVDISGGGPAPSLASIAIYNSGRVEYRSSRWETHRSQISGYHVDQVRALLEQVVFEDFLEWVRSQNFQDRYADVSEIEVKYNGEHTVVPMREVPESLLPLLGRLEQIFKMAFKDLYRDSVLPADDQS